MATLIKRSRVTTVVKIDLKLIDFAFKGIDAVLKEAGIEGPGQGGRRDLVVNIPGGGDYSNMSLDAEDVSCTITWETEQIDEEPPTVW